MKKILSLLLSMILIVSCTKVDKVEKIEKIEKNSEAYYQIFVGSYADSNQDGIGDLKGIISKLDYLDTLGVTGIWLTPIHPSESYHKYDVDHYMEVDSSFGTIEDLKELVNEGKKRNIKIILDLVLNHSSDSHPWFLEAKKDYLSQSCDISDYCDFYNFSSEKKPGYAQINANAYYEAKFWEGMPDLNLNNQKLRNEIKKITDFYLDMGVAGFRLDAVGHYDNSLEKSNEFTAWLMQTVKEKNPNAFVVGEVWSDPLTVLSNYKSGIDSLFDFKSSERNGTIISNVFDENGQKLAEELVDYTNEIYKINPKAINSLFLTNHDQARSAGYLSDDNQKKLAASIYLLSPGIPFIYYGEEIGMKGSGKDENKRLAFTWGENNDANSPKNADYKSSHTETGKSAVENDKSLYHFYRQVLTLKHKYIKKLKDADVITLNNKEIFALDYKDVKVYINLSEKEIKLPTNEVLDKIEIDGSITYKDGESIMKGYGILITK